MIGRDIRRGIRRLFRLPAHRRWERDVDDEIALHLALRIEQLMAGGRTPADARTEALRRFDTSSTARAELIAAARRRSEQMHRGEWLADVRNDVVFAVRSFNRQKGWTAVTLLTFALGIAATTAVFSAVSTLLVHAIPYPDASRVVFVFEQGAIGSRAGSNMSINPSSSVIRTWQEDARSFTALQAFASTELAWATPGGESVSLDALQIEPSFPQFAGLAPIVGRMFTAADVAADPHVALLSERIWRTQFAADSAVIGRRIVLDDSTYTVLGVLPAALRAPHIDAPTTDVWVPLDLRDPRLAASLIGRLRPGTSPAQAQSELDSLYARTSSASAGTLALRTVVATPAERVSFHEALTLLAFAAALVLLVACANVAHLLLARSSGRRRELAIRAALGAGRGRVYRQLLTESLLLAFGGSAIGVVAGWGALRALVALRSPALSALAVAHVDGPALGVALGITVLTAILFGSITTLDGGRSGPGAALMNGSRTSTTGRQRTRGRLLLVVTEMALSVTLIVGASMLVRSVIHLERADLGFTPAGLYTVALRAPRGHLDKVARATLARSVITRLAGVPGIRAVSAASTAPGWRSFSVGRLEIEGDNTPVSAAASFIDVNQVQTGYYSTMGIHLVEGAMFTDTSTAASQVIINAGFAHRQWGAASPIGKRLRIAQRTPAPWLTIVGVAADAATSGPTSESSPPMLYTPGADADIGAIVLRVDPSTNPTRAVEQAVHSLDSRITPTVRDVQAIVAESVAPARFVMWLLTLFTTIALALAAVGLYGVMAFTVAQRTREIGIRMALGATRARIATAVLASGLGVVVVGAIAGLTTAVLGGKVIEHQLYGITRFDLPSFCVAALVLSGAAALACVVPLRRALAVDPARAIRAE